MKIVNLAITYRTAVLVLVAMVVLGGAQAYVTLPKESAPSIEIPNIVVTTIYPGASPADVENLITAHIEREVQSINGIDVIRSTSVEGASTVVIEFTPDVAMSEAVTKVRDKVDLAKPDMPSDAEEPIISEIDFSEFPILTVNLAAPYSLTRLKAVAEDLEDEFESIPGVLEVDVVGALEREVRVDVDLAALKTYNLSFDDLSKTVAGENANIPGGSVDVDELSYAIRIDGQFKNTREIEDLVIKAPDGNPIFVRDVATVKFGFKDRTSHARLRRLKVENEDGTWKSIDDPRFLSVISLNIKKRSGENIIETADNALAALEAFDLPNGTQVLVTGDQSREVRTLIKDLENNIISGLIFVVAVLLFFLGFRTAMLVGVAIPLSMFASFLVFQIMGQTMNFIILFSLIIALGMLVDNAVVIVENIYRFMEEGHPPWQAAKEATAEVGGAVVASTATTVAAFAPMMMWPGMIGEFMSYMPLTLIVTLTASLFVAIILNPVITGYLARVDGDERPPMRRWIKWSIIGALVAVALILGFAAPIPLLVLVGSVVVLVPLHRFALKPVADVFTYKLLPATVQVYRRFLGWMLHRNYDVKAAYFRNTFTLVCFVGGLVLLALAGAIYGVTGSPYSAGVLGAPGALMLALGYLGMIVHGVEFIVAGVARLLGKTVNGILTDNRARLLVSVVLSLHLIVVAFVINPTGVEFFPTTDPNLVLVKAEAPLGTHIARSNELAQVVQSRIDELLEAEPDTRANFKSVLVNVGVGGDTMFGGGAASPETSRITMNLVDYEDRNESSQDTLRKIRERLKSVSGVELEFDQDQQGPPTGPPVNLEITGPDFNELKRISREVKAMLRDASDSGSIPGLVDVRDNLNAGRPEIQVRIDRALAARQGLNTRDIALMVRTAVNGAEASKFRDGEDEYDITVRLSEKDRSTLDSLAQLTFLHEGQQIPLVSIAKFEPTAGLGSITRKDRRRVVTVMANAANGFNAQEVLGKVQELLKQYKAELPPGYTFEYTGENQDQQESFAFLTTALFMGSALILLILIGQFNSVSNPAIIMVAVALSLIGVLLGLLITRTPFSLFTFIGVISLAGIVVNNNIVLLDYINQLREKMPKREAIIEGGATRLRPVLLTAMTTVLGLIPLTFGINTDFVGLLSELAPDFRIGSPSTQFWGPMGTAIISGLTFATFLTLVIVPVMYSLLDSISTKLLGPSSTEVVDHDLGDTSAEPALAE